MKTGKSLHHAVALAVALDVATAWAATFTTNTTVTVGETTYDGQDIIVSNCTLTVNGPHAFASLRLTGNAVATHTPDPNGTNGYRMQLTLAGDCVIEAGSRIDVTGCGYANMTGPGAGIQNGAGAGTGAGHGGIGGTTAAGGAGGGTYGDLLAPIGLGSGGGDAGGSGGGAVRLVVGGTLRLDGTVLADGAPPTAGDDGGGAGGSIWITAGRWEGRGGLYARGGPSWTGGGGGGGRIAFYFGPGGDASAGYSAAGGAGNEFGGAGTGYWKPGHKPHGELLVSNDGHPGQWTPLSTPGLFELTVGYHGRVYAPVPFTNTVLTIKTNGVISCTNLQQGVSLTVLGNATVEPGGKIDLSGRGFAPMTGPGAGVRNGIGNGTGAGHGGVGGTTTGGGAVGGVYGSILTPSTLGSGGGDGYGGSGGGALHVVVGGTLRVDGTVSVSGTAGSSDDGGASGGSLWAEVGALSGTGTITAAGSSSVTGGGGAGGRIALYFGANDFTGDLTAAGGGGNEYGGAGTVFTQLSIASHGHLLLDNRGHRGLTRLSQALWPAGEILDLTLTGKAHLRPGEPLTFQNLVLTNNALISHDPALTGFHLTVRGDASISADSAIGVDGLGYPAMQGTSPGGRDTCGFGSGAGHGGKGGGSACGLGGGNSYGSVTEPITLGSGGGDGGGGAGGGAIRLTVDGALRLDGVISANGMSSVNGDDGGGAGGSIWIVAEALAGAGLVSANGGAPWAGGGGGGGGHVAVYTFDATAFDLDRITAIGGLPNGIEGSRFFGVPAPRLHCARLGNELRLSWRTGVGMNYQLESATDLPTTEWRDEGAPIPGTGGVVVIDVPLGPERAKFFRLRSP